MGDRYLLHEDVEMKLPEARYADLRSRENVEIASDAPLPKTGRYQLAVVVRHSGGRLASATRRSGRALSPSSAPRTL